MLSVGCRGLGRGRWRIDRLRNSPLLKVSVAAMPRASFFDAREGRPFAFQSAAAVAKGPGLTSLLPDLFVRLVLGL